MTPKFRPFALRRFLIAAGVGLALTVPGPRATAATPSTLFWAGSSHDGASGGVWDTTSALNFSKKAPTIGLGSSTFNYGTNATPFIDNSSVVFTDLAKSVNVIVGGSNPTVGSTSYTGSSVSDYYGTTPTIFGGITLESGSSVTISGGPINGGPTNEGTTAGVFLDVKSGASLSLANTNYFSGTINISGSLTISNSRALGLTGAGNTTIVGNGASLILAGSSTPIVFVGEDLTLNNGGTLQNLSGENTYTGVVSSGGKNSSTVGVTSGSLKFTNLVSANNTATADFLVNPGASGSSVTFSGGLIMGTNASLNISSFSSASLTAGSVTIDTQPLILPVTSYLTVGGGTTLNLNTDIQSGSGTSAGSIVIGDFYGSGKLIVGANNPNALLSISSFYVNNGVLNANQISSAANIYIGASSSVALSAPNLNLSGIIKNQNTAAKSLNFSATTGTITLQKGFGYPSTGSAYFGSNAVIGTVQTQGTNPSTINGGLFDGIVTVAGNLQTTFISGGSVTVGGNLDVITDSSVTAPIGYVGDTIGIPTTNVNVSGTITAGSIQGGNITVGGDLTLYDISQSINGGTTTAKSNVYADEITGGTTTITGNLFGYSTDNANIYGGTVTINGSGTTINEVGDSYQPTTLNLNGSTTTINAYNGGDINLKTGCTLNIVSGNVIGQFSGVGIQITQNGSRAHIGGTLASAAKFYIAADVDAISGGTVLFDGDSLSYGTSSVGTMTGGTVSVGYNTLLEVTNRQDGGVINGDGALYINNTGTTPVTLSGANAYTGGTYLDSGTVCIGSNTALGSGDIFINGGALASSGSVAHTIGSNSNVYVSGDFAFGDANNLGVLTFAGNFDLDGGTRTITTIANAVITGGISNGDLIKSGAGKLTLSGQINLNSIDIQEGTLAGNTGNLSGDIDVANSGTAIEFNQDFSGTYAGVVSGDGSLGKSGTGKVILSGSNTYTGTTYVTGGTLSGGINNIKGDIYTSGTGILEFNQTGTTPATFGGNFSGAGTIQKTGAATLTTTKEIVAGTVVINNGTLVENGGITAAVVVNAAGTLKGSGTITGSVTINGGLITIGNSPAIVNLIGNHIQNGGTFVSEIGGTTPGTGAGFYDQYNVLGGSFTISGAAKLQVEPWFASGTTPFVPTRGDSFSIINASKGLVGEFDEFENNLDLSHLVIFAQHTGVVYATDLTPGDTFGSKWAPSDSTKASIYNAVMDSALTSGNSSTLSAFLDGTSADGRLAIALIKDISGTSYKKTDFSAESYFGVTDYALTVTRSVTDAALNQPVFYKQKRWAVGADYNYASNKFHGGSSTAFDRSLTGQTGFFTATYDLSDDASVGVFAGFNSGNTSTNSTHFDFKGELMGVTGKLRFNTRYPFNLKAALVNTDLSFDSQRTMLGVSSAASLTNQKLKETSLAIQADVEAMRIDRWMILANFGLSYGSASTDAFTETGSVTGLQVNGISQKSTQASVGVSTKYFKNLKLSYDLSAKLEKDFGSSGSIMSKYKFSSDAMSSVVNPSSGQTALALGLGLNYKPTASSLFTAGAELRGSSDYSSDVRLNLSYKRKF